MEVKNLEGLATLNDVVIELQNIKILLNNNENSLSYQIWTISDIAAWLKLSDSFIRQKVIHARDFPPPLDNCNYKSLKLRWFARDVINWADKNSYNLPKPKKSRL